MAKTKTKPTAAERELIRRLVQRFSDSIGLFERIAKLLHSDITSSPALAPLVKFAKYRVKDPDHLREKLERKLVKAKADGKPFKITEANLFSKVTDLAGVRLLHLHTDQMKTLNPLLLKLFKAGEYEVMEGPIANVWDHEYQEMFKSIGISGSVRGDTMYTSVHYVVRANKTPCELQVRTLSEELWGEVSHSLNYPKPTKSLPCREQLKVLARVTSSATRLVDAIFRSFDDHAAH